MNDFFLKPITENVVTDNLFNLFTIKMENHEVFIQWMLMLLKLHTHTTARPIFKIIIDRKVFDLKKKNEICKRD